MTRIASSAAIAFALAIPSPAAAADISGARAEAVVGLEGVQLDAAFGRRDDPDDSGIVYGLGAGYDVAIVTGMSIGVDLEATDSGASFREVSGADDVSFRLGRDLYAGARLTAAVSDRVNIYFKAGYTNLRTRVELINPSFSEVIRSTQDGVRAGAGGHLAIGRKAYLGAEYRFSSYDVLDRHQGMAMLGLRF